MNDLETVTKFLTTHPLSRGGRSLFEAADAQWWWCTFEHVEIGLIEPFRIESEFQGKGLGKILLTIANQRMFAAGAKLIKVSHEEKNVAARKLYSSVGFKPTFKKLFYQFCP